MQMPGAVQSGPEQSGYLVEVRFDPGVRTAFTSPLLRPDRIGWRGEAGGRYESAKGPGRSMPVIVAVRVNSRMAISGGDSKPVPALIDAS